MPFESLDDSLFYLTGKGYSFELASEDSFGANMEDSSPKKNLLSLITVVASIVGSMALLGYLSIRFLPSNGTDVYANTPQTSPSASSTTDQAESNWVDDTGALVHQAGKTKYILHKDVQKQIGRSLVTYRGKTDGSKILLDVVVLDLDPDVAYRRIIDISQTKTHFQAGEERFAFISAGSLRLRVWYFH